jgi:uncharacterized protein with HEPN domain
MRRSEKERLLDILEAIQRIEKYARRGKATFLQDELGQEWLVNQIAAIGEACRDLSDEFQTWSADVPWTEIIAMRNLQARIHSGIDAEAVWSAVEQDIPELKLNIQDILQNLDEQG